MMEGGNHPLGINQESKIVDIPAVASGPRFWVIDEVQILQCNPSWNIHDEQ